MSSERIELTPAATARRINKPLMERKRRERINGCLAELKHLVLTAMKKDSSYHSKLEKADILEMTVKHLRNMQRHQMSAAMTVDPSVHGKYMSGYNECSQEIVRYLNTVEGVSSNLRNRMISHLDNSGNQVPATPTQPIQVQIPSATTITTVPYARASMPVFPTQQHMVMSPQGLSYANSGSSPSSDTMLLPGHLPNGNVAYFVQTSSRTSPIVGDSAGSVVLVNQPESQTVVKTELQCSPPPAMVTPPRFPPTQQTSVPSPTQVAPAPGPIRNSVADKRAERVWRPW